MLRFIGVRINRRSYLMEDVQCVRVRNLSAMVAVGATMASGVPGVAMVAMCSEAECRAM